MNKTFCYGVPRDFRNGTRAAENVFRGTKTRAKFFKMRPETTTIGCQRSKWMPGWVMAARLAALSASENGSWCFLEPPGLI